MVANMLDEKTEKLFLETYGYQQTEDNQRVLFLFKLRGALSRVSLSLLSRRCYVALGRLIAFLVLALAKTAAAQKATAADSKANSKAGEFNGVDSLPNNVVSQYLAVYIKYLTQLLDKHEPKAKAAESDADASKPATA